MSIFKAYDIRGIYGEALSDELAYKIGRAFVTFLNCKKVVVGRDMRPHSEALKRELFRGLTGQGADVIDLGLASTPMSYFANAQLEADASIIITASHNPGEYNGFKLCREKAIPISGATGIKEIEQIVMDEAFDPLAETPGTLSTHDILPAYRDHIRSFADIQRPLKIAIDYANAMGIYEGKVLDGLIDSDPLFDELDGAFPNHEANPLDADTYTDLQRMVRAGTYDFGIAFDGDADRVGFVDEKGEIVSMDLITALIAQALLKKEKGTVLYDLRSSWAVKEAIEESGGTAVMCRVGHAFIKKQMRDYDAIFAGELSGHYYFRENSTAESSALAVIFIANLVSSSARQLSEWVAPLHHYHASGEINSPISQDAEALMQRLREAFPGGRVLQLDGQSIEFDDWWFNVRMSNTEPLCRLNLEAKTRAMMEERRDQILELIRSG